MNEINIESPILSIVPAPLMPAVSGGQKHTYGLLDALGKRCALICITDTHSSSDGLSFTLKPLIPHNYKKYLTRINYAMLLKQVQDIKPKAILLEQPYMALMVDRIARKTGVPFYIHAHNIEFLRFRSLGNWWWPLLYFWEKLAFSKAEAIFFISEEDKHLALKNFRIKESKCIVSPYGVPQDSVIIPSKEKVEEVRTRHGIGMDDKVFMFFGVLKYLPNIEALEIIINEVLPRLKKRYKGQFKVLICGGGISDSYKKQLQITDPEHLIYAGFVNDIDEYTQSADVILNPILNGGGVKTKVMEALGFNKNVVSTHTGSLGIDHQLCGEKLYVVEDKAWDSFVDACIEASTNTSDIDPVFFKKYGWKAIAENLRKALVQE